MSEEKPFTDHAEHILANKYYQEGENCPEDVFHRVARVISIPEVVDFLYGSKHTKKTIDLNSMYVELFNRCIRRKNSSRLEGETKFKEIKERHSLPADVGSFWHDRAKEYFNMMVAKDFIPATPIMLNAGKSGTKGMLSSCFFLDVEDSLQDIFDRVKDVAWISKLGGGVGIDLSKLRPAGSTVKGTNGNSSGPLSFLRVFNETGTVVRQGGARRAALMATMRIDHPDIIKFIECKEKEGVITNFNLSVLVTDDFMKKIYSNDAFITTFGGDEYKVKKDASTEKNEDFETEGFYTYAEVWDKLVNCAWKNGEPGIIFEDTLQRDDVFNNKYGRLGVNPCGEVPLIHGESCNLGAINLSNMFDGKSGVDYKKLEKTITNAIVFLDNTLDINFFPLDVIEKNSLRGRKIGLGTMGLHDLMLKLKIKYGSEESVSLIDELYSFIKSIAQRESAKLGKLRGVPPALADVGVHRRNSGLLSVQPTGTTSIIAGCSSGIEPNFEWEYTRKDSYGTHNIKHFMADKKDEEYAVTSLEILPQEHVSVQAAVQTYVDLSISKTCNLPNTATVEDVKAIYDTAYKLGCKSITVYRSGSRKEEVLSSSCVSEETDNQTVLGNKKVQRVRPPVLFGATYMLRTPGGKAYITINEDDDGTRECFISVSKAGSEIGSHVASEGRLISNSLQHNVPVDSIIKHLKGQKSTPVWSNGELINSVPDAVAKALEDYINNYEGFSEFIDKTFRAESKNEEDSDTISGEFCPECGENLYRESGCVICKSCGFSQCGG